MRLYPRCVVVLMFLFVPATAHAHLHVWDVAFAPSWAEGSSLWGGRISIGLTNPVPPDRNLSWLIDVTNLKDRDSHQDTTLLSYFGGLRYSVGRDADPYVFMMHGLIGAIDKHQGATGRTDFAMTAGAAFEWVLSDRTGWGARVQVEHTFIPKSGPEGYRQVSFGAVKRFK
jgi:hypothetical protein